MRIIKVKGSHLECGRQIGSACQAELAWLVHDSKTHPQHPYTWEQMRHQAVRYYQKTISFFPWIIDEIEGAAESASLDPLDLFTCTLEELYPSVPSAKCSDLIAVPPAINGGVLVGHNNDLEPAYGNIMAFVEWEFTGSPKLYSVGPGGLFVSIGINSAGICLTGNNLSQNDEKSGIPRGFIARAILDAVDFYSALSIALHPERASSYNNIITTWDGHCVNIEGSATDYELIVPVDGWLVHTNHYIHPRMMQYEAAPDLITGSIARFNRAVELTKNSPRPVGFSTMQTFLSDHGAIQNLCRHDQDARTVFSSIIDLSERKVWGCLGNPCQAKYELIWDLA